MAVLRSSPRPVQHGRPVSTRVGEAPDKLPVMCFKAHDIHRARQWYIILPKTGGQSIDSDFKAPGRGFHLLRLFIERNAFSRGAEVSLQCYIHDLDIAVE